MEQQELLALVAGVAILLLLCAIGAATYLFRTYIEDDSKTVPADVRSPTNLRLSVPTELPALVWLFVLTCKKHGCRCPGCPGVRAALLLAPDGGACRRPGLLLLRTQTGRWVRLSQIGSHTLLKFTPLIGFCNPCQS